MDDNMNKTTINLDEEEEQNSQTKKQKTDNIPN